MNIHKYIVLYVQLLNNCWFLWLIKVEIHIKESVNYAIIRSDNTGVKSMVEGLGWKRERYVTNNEHGLEKTLNG